MQQHTVFLLPSDDLRWTAVRAILHEIADVVIVGEAAHAMEAIHAIAALHPDVIVASDEVGGVPVRALLTNLRRICGPTTRFIVVAAEVDPDNGVSFLEIGVAGYLLWNGLPYSALQSCLTTALTCKVYIGSDAVAETLSASITRSAPDAAIAGRGDRTDMPACTRREDELLDAIARGWDNARIADELCLKQQTVRRYVSDLYDKIGVENRCEAIVWAKDHGFGASWPTHTR